jgi:hypothetical protein
LSLELGIYNFDLITNQITMAWLGDLTTLKDKIEFDSDIFDIFDIFVGPFKLISEDKLMACYYTSLLPFQLHINKMLLFTTYRWISLKTWEISSWFTASSRNLYYVFTTFNFVSEGFQFFRTSMVNLTT